MKVPAHLNWKILRLVLAEKISRTEAKTTLSINDIEDLNEALDLQQEADRREMERLRKE